MSVITLYRVYLEFQCYNKNIQKKTFLNFLFVDFIEAFWKDFSIYTTITEKIVSFQDMEVHNILVQEHFVVVNKTKQIYAYIQKSEKI